MKEKKISSGEKSFPEKKPHSISWKSPSQKSNLPTPDSKMPSLK
jgi:hypothetical protein